MGGASLARHKQTFDLIHQYQQKYLTLINGFDLLSWELIENKAYSLDS